MGSHSSCPYNSDRLESSEEQTPFQRQKLDMPLITPTDIYDGKESTDTISQLGLKICKHIYSNNLSLTIDDKPITLEECIGAAVWYADPKTNLINVDNLKNEHASFNFHLRLCHCGNMTNLLKCIYNFDKNYEEVQGKDLLYNKVDNMYYAMVPRSEQGYEISIVQVNRRVTVESSSLFGLGKHQVQ